ncbi:hypothetical protein CDD81_2510 [Ophiocordyceps australis]|uniref:AAA+ ATPase domain-containing protein n=1 Tax=Ophiocordyceps australis TaxID=1399860 RepID=A0A2C5YCH1_9HYPO|nr:hypothetical protein CDD81_2510 [Ophiocordyceps australis]
MNHLLKPRFAIAMRRVVRPVCVPSSCVCRRRLTSGPILATFDRSPDLNSGFTGSYDPTAETSRGPMFAKSKHGVPQFYPRDLKKCLDAYVVGQDRAKRIICSTLFNHYQNYRRRHQIECKDRQAQEKLERQRSSRDKVDVPQGMRVYPAPDEYTRYLEHNPYYELSDFNLEPLEPPDLLVPPNDPVEPHRVNIDKSNLLLIGPTGVGKTYILETLSKKLRVPFSICDCNSLTQAGYIGQDVETCIERLLIEANYDVAATQRGIVVLDEFDKLARRESPTGRDVGGEGVQQALLKLLEGTKVTLNCRNGRSIQALPANISSLPPTGPGKMEQYTVDTTNILFILCGAFVGLDKVIVKRLAKPSIGFGGDVQGRSTMAGTNHQLPPEMYRHLAHHNPSNESSFTPMDLVSPADLQSFGFIPELIGRLHNICALSPLSREDLLRVLTEPCNSLVAQYTALFETYPSKLFFTQKALYAIAERAFMSATGARGLKMEMERVLAEPMFDSPTPLVLITEACVKGTEKAAYWGKDGRFELDRRLEAEDMQAPNPQAPSPLGSFREAGQSNG